MIYLSAGGAVSVLLTQGAVLRGQQQMALTPSLAVALLCLGAGLRLGAVPQQAAGQRRAPAARLVREAGQAGHVGRAGAGAVRLQEEEGDLLMWGKKKECQV